MPERQIQTSADTAMGVTMALMAAFYMGIITIFLKLITYEETDFITVIFLRTSICLPIFWVLMKTKLPSQGKTITNKQLLACVSAGIIGYYAGPMTALLSLSFIDASLEVVVFSTFPVFVMVVNAFYHRRLPSRQAIAALILIEIGIYLAMGGIDVNQFGSDTLWGVFWAFICALTMAYFIVVNQFVTRTLPVLRFIVYAMVSAYALMAIHFTVSIYRKGLYITHEAIILTIAMAVCYLLATFFSSSAIQKIGGTRVAFFGPLGTVFAVILAYVFLGETMSALQFFGTVVVITMLLMLEGKALAVFIRNSRRDKNDEHNGRLINMAGHSKFANIKHRKGAQDAKRAKLFTKLTREIIVAAANGQPDPDFNPRLRNALIGARKAGVPKDRIETAIKKGAGELESEAFEEIRYEGYGPDGIALIVEVLTDNRNRSAAEVRSTLAKYGGSLGETGSVGFMFERVGLIQYPTSITDADTMFEAALEAGANNCESDIDLHEITCEPDDFSQVRDALAKQFGDPDEAHLSWKAKDPVVLDTTEKAEKILKIIDILDDSDDVQSVSANFDIPDEVAQQLTA